MSGVIFIVSVIVLIIQFVLAGEFYSIANDKGYDNQKYLWYCFLFGIAGYLMVIALPKKEKIAKASNDELPEI